MLLPRKWVLSLGLLATAPGIVLAGPFDGKSKSNARPTTARPTAMSPERPAAAAAKPAKPAKAKAQRSNDEIAQDVAKAFKAAGLKGKGVQIEVVDGVASLSGQILNSEQLAKATQVASRVPGIESVDNQLTAIETASAQTRSGSRQPIQRVEFEEQVQATPAPAGPSNQQVAQGIADKLAEAGLNGYDIEIRFKNGACSLLGDVSNSAEAAKAQQAAESVEGVQEVLNQLSVAGRPAAAPQMAHPGMGGRPYYPQGMAVGEGQLPPGVPPQAMGQNPQQIQQMQMQMQQARMQQMQLAQAQMGGPGMDGSPMGAPGMGGPGMGGAPQGGVAPAGHHMMYNQPNVPEYAWPTYAQYDNYAAVTYPGQYDASAFPYIGPFYPYPQVPLNWRQSTLEWKDGNWNLRFSTKTDKWWWFMQPKNW